MDHNYDLTDYTKSQWIVMRASVMQVLKLTESFLASQFAPLHNLKIVTNRN